MQQITSVSNPEELTHSLSAYKHVISPRVAYYYSCSFDLKTQESIGEKKDLGECFFY